MTEDRLQRIEEILIDLKIKMERSFAATEARVDGCHSRFAANEVAIQKLSGKVDGNGQVGISTRLDRIEQNQQRSSKWFWAGIGFFQAVAIVLIKYVLP